MVTMASNSFEDSINSCYYQKNLKTLNIKQLRIIELIFYPQQNKLKVEKVSFSISFRSQKITEKVI